MIHIGFSQGKPVEIPLQHTILAAITRYGKSTALKHMKESLPEDFTVLFLDVKRPRDFAGMGVEIPIYLEDRTDPVGLKSLLEASGKMGLKFEFSELIKVCKQLAAEDKEGRYGFRDVLNGITRNLKEKMHPIRESKLLVLQHLLGRLVRDLDKTEIAGELKLPSRFNVMNLSKAPRMVKQLAVYSTIKWILERGKNTVIILDEIPDFAPQRHGTPAREVIGEAVRKGGASDIWCWLSGQIITGVDKNVLKECNFWILGRQREWNEAKRTLNQIPFKTGLKVEDIMKLPVGHFIVVSEEGAYLTYVQPPGIDAETAKKVSLGELTVKDVQKLMVMEEEEDLVWREKYLEEKRKREKLEKEFARQVERLSDLKIEEKVESLQRKLEEADVGMEQLRKDLDKSYKEVERLNFEVKDLRRFKQLGEDADNLRQAFTKFLRLDEVAKAPGSGPPTELAINVETKITEFDVTVRKETLHATQDEPQGQILILASEGWFDERRNTRDVRAELDRRFNSRPRPGTVENIVADLAGKQIFVREKASGKKGGRPTWLYSLRAEAKERIKVTEKETRT